MRGGATKPFRHAVTLLLAASYLVFAGLVLTSPSPTGSLEPRYTDHFRHLKYVAAFAERGLGIYQTRLAEIVTPDDPPTPERSLPTGYPYPLGALVFFAPFTLAWQTGVVSLDVVAKIMTLVLLAAAHWATYAFVRAVQSEKAAPPPFVEYTAALIFYVLVVFWALNNQFDPVPLAAASVAGLLARRGSPSVALIFLAAALLLKYHALVFLPVIGSLALSIWPGRREKPATPTATLELPVERETSRLALGAAPPRPSSLLPILGLAFPAVALLVDAATILLGYPLFPAGTENPLQAGLLANPGHDRWVVATFIALSVFMSIQALRAPSRLLAISMAFASIWMLTTNLLQSWHLLWLFPLPLFVRNQSARQYGYLWVLGTHWLLGWLPNPSYILRLLVEGPG